MLEEQAREEVREVAPAPPVGEDGQDAGVIAFDGSPQRQFRGESGQGRQGEAEPVDDNAAHEWMVIGEHMVGARESFPLGERHRIGQRLDV